MLAKERHNKIYALIQNEGAVTASKLVKLFGVSAETVRRDLQEIENDKLLKKVHGGAVAINKMKQFEGLKIRNSENSEQKYELSQKASEFVYDGDIIAVDSGSTAKIFAEVLSEKFSDLTVITYSTDVFEALRGCKNISVILCGGYHLREENAFFGEFVLDMLDNLHVKKAFVFPSAVSAGYGIADFQRELYPMQKKLISIADEVYVLADSSKFEKKGLLKVDDMKSEYTYITDSHLNGELLELYRENDLKIYLGAE